MPYTRRILRRCPHCTDRPRLYHDEETGEYCVEFENDDCLHDTLNDSLYRHDKAREAIAEWNSLRRQ